MESHPVQPISVRLEQKYTGYTDDPLPFLIVIEENLYLEISASIDIYTADLIAEDYDPILYTVSGGTALEFKDEILIPEWELGAVGAIIIGDLPVPWFELYEDFDNDGIPDDPYTVDFPCDLFFMDLDGDWRDDDLDGIYDVHEGAMEPDFWIGRLYASAMSGNEADLINNYFAKLHDYRTGALYLPEISLAYIDDDWSGGAPVWASYQEEAFANTVLVNDINETTADDYMARWDDDYQYVLLAAHSNPSLHSLTENNGLDYQYIWNYEIIDDDPHFLFYNLFCCSNCLFTSNNFCGGAYLFNDTYGINVVGSTKTGAMLYFEDYFPHLGAGETFGEALNQWFAINGNIPGSEMWSRSWFYGMCGLGDPTITLDLGIKVSSFTIIDEGSGMTVGDGDGIADAGETVELQIYYVNQGTDAYNDLEATVSTSDTLIQVLSSTVLIPSLTPGDSALVGGIVLEIAPYTVDLHGVRLDFEINEGTTRTWYEKLDFNVRAPSIDLVSYDWREISGNMDGMLDEGETIGITLEFMNYGGQEATKDNFTLTSPQGCFGDITIPDSYYFPLDETVSFDEIELEFDFFPDGHAAYAHLLYNDPAPFDDYEMFYLPGGETANIFDDCADEEARKNYPVSDGYHCEWNFENSLYYSSPTSMRYGEGVNYLPLGDGAMELPLVKLGPNTELSFYHQYNIEPGYDGGILEIFHDNEWQLIEPIGGYPGTSVSNGSYPGGPCYNGELTYWMEGVFDLSAYEGCVRLRFRFGSDGGAEEAGWYVDNITIDSDVTGVVHGTSAEIPADFKVIGNYPNPFNAETTLKFALPKDGEVKVTVFNSAGGEVDVLADGLYQSGIHQINWNASNFSTGLYFFEVQFEGKSIVKKTMLLK